MLLSRKGVNNVMVILCCRCEINREVMLQPLRKLPSISIVTTSLAVILGAEYGYRRGVPTIFYTNYPSNRRFE